MTTSLPQHDDDLAARQRDLDAKRQTYRYKYTYLEPLALAEEVPWAHKPRLRWWTAVLRLVAGNVANSLALKADHVVDQLLSFDDSVEQDEALDELDDLIESAERVLDGELAGVGVESFVDGDLDGPMAFGDDDGFGFFSRLRRALSKSTRSAAPESGSVEQEAERLLRADMEEAVGRAVDRPRPPQLRGKATSLEDYDRLFKRIKPPQARASFQSDDAFARLRVAGPNPTAIERCGVPGAAFPVSAADYQAAMHDPEDSLENAAADGRLYLSDYRALDGLPAGCHPGPRKYVFAPLVLYAVPRAGADRSLRAVAIQLGQRPRPEGVVTPKDGARWQLAKSATLIADGCVHEAVTHLGRTHLFIEPFVTATERQLHARHPLYALLRPHFEGTLYINYQAHKVLIAAEGGANALVSPTIDAARMVAVLGVQSLAFDDASLPRELARRGVDDPARLPDYPYRDDGLLLWRAIHDWVERYVALYYAGDADVIADRELQAWAAELASWEGGRVTGFGQDGGVKTRAYLVEALTILIFTASAQHAAVNFSQYPLMGYAPAYPMSGYSDGASGSWFDLLPPLEVALTQAETTRVLGSVYHTRLGEYEAGNFPDPRVAAPLQEFQAALARVEETITARNQRREPYTFLLPSRIPQSINI